MALLLCRRMVVPAPGAATGGFPAERCMGRPHLRHLLLCLAQSAPRSSREPALLLLPCLAASSLCNHSLQAVQAAHWLSAPWAQKTAMKSRWILSPSYVIRWHVLSYSLNASGLYAKHVVCVGCLHAMAF